MFVAAREEIRQFSELSLADLTEAELTEAMTDLVRLQGAIDAVLPATVAAWDTTKVWAADAALSGPAWMTAHTGLPRRECNQLLDLGRKLRSMPHTSAALTAGLINRHAAKRLAALNTDRLRELFAEAEEMLVEIAATCPFPRFERAAALWKYAALDSLDGPADDLGAETRDRRHLHASPTLDGGYLNGFLDPTNFETFNTALSKIEAELFEADWAQAQRDTGETKPPLSALGRTSAQRRADALVEMAKRAMTAPADGKQPRPLLTVLVNYETLVGTILETEHGTPLSRSDLLALLDETDIERIVFGPNSRILDVGRQTRFFTGAIRRAIQIRDRTCQAPGCDRAAIDCEIDHGDEVHDGGQTTQTNGHALCKRHHRLKSAGKIGVRRDPDGRLWFVRPDGTVIRTGHGPPPAFGPDLTEPDPLTGRSDLDDTATDPDPPEITPIIATDLEDWRRQLAAQILTNPALLGEHAA